MRYPLLFVINALVVVLTVTIGVVLIVVQWLLEAAVDGFTVAIDALKSLHHATHKELTANCPVAFTFNRAVRYWRKNLAIARDIDSKNYEIIADMRRTKFRQLQTMGFQFKGTPAEKRNVIYKEWRFAGYVLNKRNAT